MASSSACKRRRTDEQAASHLAKAFESGQHDDEVLVKRVMRGNPMVAKFIADLWRKGTLAKAMRQSLGEKAFETSLGTKFGPKVLQFSNLPRSFKFNLFFTLLKKYRGDDVVTEEEWVISDKEVSQWLDFGLSVTGKVTLPREHAKPDYEGTMALVLIQRAHDMGDRLKELMVDNRSEYGYFVWSSDKPLDVRCVLCNVVVKLDFTEEFFEEHADWDVINNHSLDAKLASDSAGMSIALAKLFEKTGFKFPRVDLAFECPNAADSLRDAEEPAEEKSKKGPCDASEGAQRWKSKAKAKARGPRRPPRNPRPEVRAAPPKKS